MAPGSSEWNQLRDLVSPSFFDVLPARDLRRQIGALARNAVRRREYERVRTSIGDDLLVAGLPIRLGAAPEPGTMDREQQGRLVLELFFRQMFHHETAVLDLRARRFGADGDTLWWNPRALWVRWDEEFLAAVRELYIGFYEEDRSRFAGALERLDLSCAEDTFRRQFGQGPANAVAFAGHRFRSAFHDTFVACREAGTRLHPNFLPLGIVLACLYEHLEQLGGSHNVLAAFRSSRAG